MPEEKDVEKEIIALEHKFIAACASNDISTLDEILAEDFIFTDPKGNNLTKHEWLSGIKNGEFGFESATVEDVRVNVRTNVAVVSARIKLKAFSKKAKYDGTFLAMDLYQKLNERWQITLSTADEQN